MYFDYCISLDTLGSFRPLLKKKDICYVCRNLLGEDHKVFLNCNIRVNFTYLSYF